MTTRRALHGDHNQCAGCGEFFNSSKAFDRHRIGEHGVDRRCMTSDEMKARGMLVSSAGWWITEARNSPPSPSVAAVGGFRNWLKGDVA